MLSNPLLVEQLLEEQANIKIADIINTDNIVNFYKNLDNLSLNQVLELSKIFIIYTTIYNSVNNNIKLMGQKLEQELKKMSSEEKEHLNKKLNNYFKDIDNRTINIEQYLYELFEISKIESYEDLEFNLTKMFNNSDFKFNKYLQDLALYYIKDYKTLILSNKENENKFINLIKTNKNLDNKFINKIKNLLSTEEANYIRNCYKNLIPIEDERTQFYDLNRIRKVVLVPETEKEQRIKAPSSSMNFKPTNF